MLQSAGEGREGNQARAGSVPAEGAGKSAGSDWDLSFLMPAAPQGDL